MANRIIFTELPTIRTKFKENKVRRIIFVVPPVRVETRTK